MKSLTLKKGGFAEIYSDGLYFGLLDSKGEVYNGTTCCKDFFTDAFWAEHHQKGTSIHGFKCSPGRMNLGDATYQIALHHSKSLGDKKLNLEAFLNAFDKSFGIKPFSQVEKINEGKDLLITFSQGWTTRPVMISLLTGLMRVGLMAEAQDKVEDVFERLLQKGNPWGQYDKSEFSKKGVVPLILESYKKGKAPHPEQSYKQYADAYDAHHGGGIIAFTTGISTS